ncbi:MAG: hypothetical protein AAF772_19240, partial [Acidobacteriota bacterium]
MPSRSHNTLLVRRFSVVLGLLLLATTASLGAQTLTFIDAAGQPTATFVEGARFDVRLDEPSLNSSPGFVDFVSIQVSALFSGDQVFVDCFETGPDTGIFEGGANLGTVGAPPPFPGLQTAVDPGPPAQRDTLQATFGPSSATAGLVGAAARWTDADGTPVTRYALGQTVHLEVEDRLFGSDGFVDQLWLRAESVSGGDQEDITLIETGPSTGIYRGSLSSRSGPSFPFNSELDAFDGDTLRFTHTDFDGIDVLQADASAVASLTVFIDADGQPTDTLLAGGQGRVRVIDFNAFGSTNVELSAQQTGDQESIFLTETGIGTGVFEGAFNIEFSGGANSFDGILQTGQSPGPPPGPDTVDALHFDTGSGSTAQATTRFSIVTLRDAADDTVRAAFVAGDTLRVHVQAPVAGSPGFIDSIP